MFTVMSKQEREQQKRWNWNVTGPTHCGQVCKSLSPCLHHNMIYLLLITNVFHVGGKKWRTVASNEVMKCWSEVMITGGNLVSLLERWSHSNTQQKWHLDVLLWLDSEHVPRLSKVWNLLTKYLIFSSPDNDTVSTSLILTLIDFSFDLWGNVCSRCLSGVIVAVPAVTCADPEYCGCYEYVYFFKRKGHQIKNVKTMYWTVTSGPRGQEL